MQNSHELHRLSGFDPRPIFDSAPRIVPGQGDFVIGGETMQVLGRMAACYMGVRSNYDLRYFKGVTVIAPPKLAWDASDDAIHRSLAQGFEDIWSVPIPDGAAGQFITRASVHRCVDLDAAEVVAYIDSLEERRIVVVPEAHIYRSPTLAQDSASSRAGALLPEHTWLSHAARLALACLASAKTVDSVVVFNAKADGGGKQNNADLLAEIEELVRPSSCRVISANVLEIAHASRS